MTSVAEKKVHMIGRLQNSIPSTLRERPNWVAWKAEMSTDTGGQVKTRKVPMEVKQGRVLGKARSNDHSTWTTFEEAIAAYEHDDEMAGVGFQFGETPAQREGIVGIDLDECDDWATFANWLTAEFGSWSERSQSGRGRHIFVRGVLSQSVKIDKGNTAGIDHKALEMYDNGRFFAMTGDRIGKEHEITERQEMVDILLMALQQYDKMLKWVKRLATTDEKRANEFAALWNGTDTSDSKSNGDWSLCGWLLRWTEGNVRVADLLFRMSGRYAAREASEKAWDSPRHGSNRSPETGEPLYDDRPVGEPLTYGEYTLGKRFLEWRKKRGERERLESRVVSAAAPRDILGTAELSEYGNGECFAALNRGKFAFNATDNVWMMWNGVVWEVDKRGAVKQAARETIRLRAEYAKLMDDEEAAAALIVYAATKCGGYTYINNVLGAAASFPDMTVIYEDFARASKTLLCAQNGVYDLESHAFRDAKPEDMLEQQLGTVYDPVATCPRWEQFLREVLVDEATIAYVQRAFGYSLTASTKEQIMLILTGLGSNGKSLLLNVVAKVMGTYRGNASFETFEAREGHSGGHNEALASLRGTRYITIIESNEGKRLNEARVKMATGGDTVSASKKYGHQFDFEVEGKIWLAVNRKPRIIGTDNGIWRRIHLIEFNQTFDEKTADKDLKQKLEAELPGILNWMLEGYQQWREHGLGRPDELKDAVKAYREESDALAMWIDECCTVGPNEKCQTDEAYDSYKAWTQRMGEFTLGRNVWLARMEERGFERKKLEVKELTSGSQRVYRWHLLGVDAAPTVKAEFGARNR